ncbi:MAG: 3-keto-5-aminohexanoate cleavage protein [Anaerolineae bacterium]
MKYELFITAAITGAGATQDKHPDLPITPEQIANSAIEAAKAGAAICHMHVRDPKTGVGSRDVGLYTEVFERCRAADVDMVINFTAGMGGDLVFGSGNKPLPLNADGTDIAPPIERLAHVTALRPEICTLDCGTMNFAAGGDYVMANTPGQLEIMAKHVQELGVKPELEVFDYGHLVYVKELIRLGLLDDPILIQLCMGIPYGMPNDALTLATIASQVPDGAIYSAFSIGRMQLPYVGMSAGVGANIRVGLEDNLYLDRGVFASNADLVTRAVNILSNMNIKVMGPEAVREKLGLVKH